MKISAMRFTFTMAGVMMLAACGTAYPGSPQACAGINEAAIAYAPATGKVDVKLCAGKENENVKLSGKLPDGVEFLYEAQGGRAFAGQMSQAELSETLSRERGETIREIIRLIKPLSLP